jgi:two-component system sensor histidine kinase TctE
LRRRLLGGLCCVLAVIAWGLYFLLANYAARAADRAFDQLLLASALTIADALNYDDRAITVDLPYAALAILATGRRDRIFYRIAGPDGALITGYPDLGAALPLARSSTPRYSDIRYRETPLRAAVLGRFVASAGGSWVTIVVAHSREERTALAGDILANAFLPVLLVTLVAGGLIWFGVRRALAPLTAIERLVRDREPMDLSPITGPAPSEVRQLLAALNRFMQRLQANLTLMQTFLAEAAHQIRTPLATLRAQADLAVEEDDAATLRSYVYKIHRNAALASQVTNQLLSDTMVAHRGQLGARERIELVALLRQVAQRAESGGGSPPIELDLRALHGPALIEGDPITLREAFTNLLDNARLYAGDQIPVQIRVAPTADGRSLQVDVADRGPGIAEDEKARVFERFTRGAAGRHATGSGLGLAIVKAVADAHGASIALLDRPGGGLVVRVAFRIWVAPPAGANAHIAGLGALSVMLLLAPDVANAAAATLYPARTPEHGRLLIHGVTDRPLMEPLLLDFQVAHPGIAVAYVELSTNELYHSIVTPAGPVPDLAISSAMDLQAKLVNDGWTQPHVSRETLRLPDWANWRNEAFGYALEPAVIVHDRRGVAEGEAPHSRSELLRLLQAEPQRFSHRVATYDIASSGVGYLFATQDSVLSGQFWRLTVALGDVGVRLFPNSSDVLDAIERGEVLIGYNVLGSYARARQQAGAPIGIELPRDYTLLMSRTVAIPKAARDPVSAKLFLDYLLSDRGQAIVAATAGLQPLLGTGDTAPTLNWPLSESGIPAQPITLGPALLVFLDRLKRERFLADWSAAVHRR